MLALAGALGEAICSLQDGRCNLIQRSFTIWSKSIPLSLLPLTIQYAMQPTIHSHQFIILWTNLSFSEHVLSCLKSLFVLFSRIGTVFPHFLFGEIVYEMYLKCYNLHKTFSRDFGDFLTGTLGLYTICITYKYIVL